MLHISDSLSIPLREIDISAVRAQGSGGQNVNKVSTAVHLRFEIERSSLPVRYKKRLLRLRDRRITADGVIVIKAQQHRTQEKNRQEALKRLQEIVRRSGAVPKKRIRTTPPLSVDKKRLNRKVKRGRLKSLRKKVDTANE